MGQGESETAGGAGTAGGIGLAGGAGLLVVAATPIGDPDDASARLVRELGTADVIAAEDTRRLHRLAASLGVKVDARVVSYFEGNEVPRTAELLTALTGGARVLLVTDAGMPSVSDPGYRLVAAAVESGVRVTAAPGPSAVVTALAVSGLPVDRFCFEGFPPRRPRERSRWFEALATESRTMVFFESRHRLVETLRAMGAAFGDSRRAAVCRELTKTHEEVRRGTLDELIAWAAESGPLGEITVVVSGALAAVEPASEAETVALVAAREAAGLTRKEAIAEVARELGVPKRSVYSAVVSSK